MARQPASPYGKSVVNRMPLDDVGDCSRPSSHVTLHVTYLLALLNARQRRPIRQQTNANINRNSTEHSLDGRDTKGSFADKNQSVMDEMQQVQIQFLSDLHLEAPASYDIFSIDPKAPFLALLGDVGYVKDEGFFDFLRKQLENFCLVLFIFGNHEPYYSNWPMAKSKVRQFKDETDNLFRKGDILGQFIILDQTRYDVSATLTILGCTLFSRVAAEQTDYVSFGLNDFYHIGDWSVEAHNETHAADLAWLNSEVEAISRLEPERKIVVFTHYCPSTHGAVIDPRHAGSKISSGFMTDLSMESCWQHNNVKLWAFGHTHFNCDFRDDGPGKQVVSNQRGYYFAQAAGFDTEKII